jgi:hypothetical protein
VAIFLAGGILAAATGAVIESGAGEQRCLFADGSSVPGRCMFLEEFDGSTLNADRWLPENDMVSALLEHAAPWGCVRQENVSVSGGTLRLAMTNNVRAECPQSWTTNAAYDAITAGNFPAPTGTSFDTAAVSMRAFHFTYGRYLVRAQLAGGTSPWSGILMWGQPCQAAGAMNGLMEGIFTQTGPCNWPTQPEWNGPSYVHSLIDGKQAIFTSHRAAGQGAPFLRNYYGIPYYGQENAPAGPGILPEYQFFITSVDFGDLSLGFHVYELDWRPGSYSFLIDGQLCARAVERWVPRIPMFMQLWNVDSAPAAVGLPQTMQVDYVRVVCPPGVPCSWSVN